MSVQKLYNTAKQNNSVINSYKAVLFTLAPPTKEKIQGLPQMILF